MSTFKPTPPMDALAQGGTISVQRRYPDNTTDADEHDLPVHVFLTNPATVSAKTKRTINTGNYESLGIEVMVSLPCYVEEAEAALEHASSIAGLFLAREEDSIRVMMGQKPVWNLEDADEKHQSGVEDEPAEDEPAEDEPAEEQTGEEHGW